MAVAVELTPAVDSLSFTTEVRALRDAARLAAFVAPRKSATPALEHVRLEARNGIVTLAATCLDADVRVRVEADIREPGVAVMPAKQLADALSRAKGNVTIEAHGSAVHVRTGNGWFTLLRCPDGDFPMLAEPSTRAAATISGADLARMVRRIAYAMSADETREHLFGALLEADPKEQVVRLVSCDGHRLALAAARSTSTSAVHVLVHRRAIEVLARAAFDREQTVAIHIEKERVRFVGERVHVSARIVEAAFPCYLAVIPGDASSMVSLDRTELLSAIRAIAGGSRSGVRLDIVREHELVTLTTEDADGHSAVIEVPADIVGAAPIRIGFAQAYLRELLESLDQDRVVFRFTGELDPAKVIAEDDSIAVLMPRRT